MNLHTKYSLKLKSSAKKAKYKKDKSAMNLHTKYSLKLKPINIGYKVGLSFTTNVCHHRYTNKILLYLPQNNIKSNFQESIWGMNQYSNYQQSTSSISLSLQQNQ